MLTVRMRRPNKPPFRDCGQDLPNARAKQPAFRDRKREGQVSWHQISAEKVDIFKFEILDEIREIIRNLARKGLKITL